MRKMYKNINMVFIYMLIGIFLGSGAIFAENDALRPPSIFQIHRDDEIAINVANEILSSAHGEGRSNLYEYEVYAILKALGIGVPQYVLIRGDARSLPRLPEGEKLVIKMLTQAEHKTEFSGVKIVNSRDAEASIRSMSSLPGAEGVVVYEYVEKADEMAELLVGISETSSGSLVCFGKGGELADYQPDRSYQAIRIPYDIERLIRSTSIGREFIFASYRGKRLPLRDGDLIEAIGKLVEFKKAYDRIGKFKISDLEINPLICTTEGKLVACDGVLKFAPRQETLQPKDVRRLKNVFNPKKIVLVGASPKGQIRNLMDNLIDSVKRGALEKEKLYFVNPRFAKTGENYKGFSYCREEDVPEDADLHIVAMSSDKSTGIAEGYLRKGKCVVIIAGGYDEVKGGEELQGRLAREMESSPPGAVLVGPNTMGVEVGGISCTFVPRTTGMKTSPNGNTAISCQSGAILAGVMTFLRYTNIKYGVSIGNALDVGQADVLEYILKYEPDIRVVGLYIESLKDADDADRLLKLIRQARDQGVYIIIRKAGSTEIGSLMTATHTGRPAGKFEYFKSVFEHAGAQVTNDFGYWAQMIYLASAISAPGKTRPKDNNVFCFSQAGGDVVTMADRSGNLKMNQPDDELKRVLDNFKLQTTTKNPFDFTGAGTNRDFLVLLDYLARWDGCNAIAAGYIPWLSSTVDEEILGFIEKVSAINKKTTKPIVFIIQDYSIFSARYKEMLRKNGIAVFDNVESCMNALNGLLSPINLKDYYSKLYDRLIQDLRERAGKIIESSANYITRISVIIAKEKKKGKVLMVAMDGNSGASKTTSARDIGEAIKLSGGKAVVIERDWFIGSRTERQERFDDELRRVDVSLWDNEMALRSDKFERDVLNPLRDFNNGTGQEMTLSLSDLYDKDRGGKLTRSESFKIDRETVVIIEGNFLLIEKWKEYFDFKIVFLAKPSIGIKRRLIRDDYAEKERTEKIFWRINTPSYVNYLQQNMIRPDLLIITDTWGEEGSAPLQKIAAPSSKRSL